MSEIGSTSESAASAVVDRRKSTSLVRMAVVILLLAVIVSVVSWTGYVWWNSKDGTVSWKNLTLQDRPPKLVEVTGQILYKGRPVTNGSIITEINRKGLFGGMSNLDKEGRFSLMTHIDGELHNGAYVGKHTVAIASYAFPTNPAGPPPGLVPKMYLENGTSPLRMLVTSDPKKNVFVFKLTGELESVGSRGSSGRNGQPSGRGRKSRQRPQPASGVKTQESKTTPKNPK